MLLGLLLAVNLVGRWMSFGPEDQIVGDVAVAAGSNRRVFAVGFTHAAGTAVFRSEDGGVSWEPVTEVPGPGGVLQLEADPRDPDRLFVATLFFSDARLYRSVDGGASWSLRQALVAESFCQIAFDAVEPDTIYLSYGGIDKIFRSVDGGETFATLPAPFLGALLASAPDGSLVAASGNALNSIVSVSRDRGETWTPTAPPPVQCPVRALAIDPSDSNRWFVGYGYSVVPWCGEVVRTEDAGATWVRVADHIGPVTDLAIDVGRPDVLFASREGALPSPGYPHGILGSVWSTTDGGETWIDLHLPVLSGAGSIALTEDGSRLYAATGLGVYLRDLRRPRTLPPR